MLPGSSILRRGVLLYPRSGDCCTAPGECVGTKVIAATRRSSISSSMRSPAHEAVPTAAADQVEKTVAAPAALVYCAPKGRVLPHGRAPRPLRAATGSLSHDICCPESEYCCGGNCCKPENCINGKCGHRGPGCNPNKPGTKPCEKNYQCCYNGNNNDDPGICIHTTPGSSGAGFCAPTSYKGVATPELCCHNAKPSCCVNSPSDTVDCYVCVAAGASCANGEGLCGPTS